MRVVLDANVYVSAFISKRGAPYRIINLWKDGAFELLTSEPILDEIERVLRCPKIAALHQRSESELAEFATLLRDESHMITPSRRLAVSPDEPDNRYVECAAEGNADYLVSGDKKHLRSLKEYRGIKIISPTAFLTLMRLG